MAPVSDPATAVAAHPTAAWAAFGSEAGMVAVVDARAGAPAFRLRTRSGAPVASLAVSADARLVAAGHEEGTVTLWRTDTGVAVASWEEEVPVRQCAFAGARRLVTLAGSRVTVREAGAETTRSRPVGDGDGTLSADAFEVTPSGLVLLDGFEVGLWDANRGAVTRRHRPVRASRFLHVDGLVGLSPGGRFLFVYWDDFLLFDALTGARAAEAPFAGPATAGAVTADGTRLVLGGRNGRLRLLEGGAELRAEVDAAGAPIEAVALGAAGSLAVYLARDGSAGVVDARTGTVMLSPARVTGLLAL